MHLLHVETPPTIIGNFSVFTTYILLSGLYRHQVAAAVDLRFFTRTRALLTMSICRLCPFQEMLKTCCFVDYVDYVDYVLSKI